MTLRSLVTNSLEAIGLSMIVIGAYLIAPVLGLIVAGFALLLISRAQA